MLLHWRLTAPFHHIPSYHATISDDSVKCGASVTESKCLVCHFLSATYAFEWWKKSSSYPFHSVLAHLCSFSDFTTTTMCIYPSSSNIAMPKQVECFSINRRVLMKLSNFCFDVNTPLWHTFGLHLCSRALVSGREHTPNVNAEPRRKVTRIPKKKKIISGWHKKKKCMLKKIELVINQRL